MPTAIRHVSRAARLAVSLPFALGLGCSTTVEPPLPSELVEVGVTPPASTPVAAISSASAGPAANVAASATAPGSDPTSFPCSDVSCRVGETCCSSPTVGHCIATVNDGPGGAIGYLKTQWDQCAALPYRGSNWSRIARCDESDDCAEGKVCCEGFLFSGSDGLADCLDLPKNGKTPCDFAEVCMAGSKCRTPGTTCIKGACRKIPVRQRCDKATCSADAPYCCSSGCSADPLCGGGARIACSRDADCLPGERCLDEAGTTMCLAAHPDADHAAWVCQTDRECAKVCSGYGGGKPSCREASVPWLKSCGCQ